MKAAGRPGFAEALSAAAFVTLALAGVGHAIVGWPPLRGLGVACTVVFLVLQVRRSPRFQIVMAAALIALGLAVGQRAGDVSGVLVGGLVKAQVFLVLFFATAWLQVPASASPALRAVRRAVVSQPPGRRFAYLAGGGHLLGSVLNIAGLVLLSPMVERQTDRQLQRRMAAALMQGFVAASIWSPFYVSVIVVLIALPELGWSDAILGGLPLAGVTVGCAWVFDRAVHRRPSGAAAPSGHPLGMPHRRNLVCVLGSLAAIVIGTVELTGWSLPVTLAVVAPPFGTLWIVLVAGPSAPPPRAAGQLVRAVFWRLPELRNESLAFVAASIFGIGVATGFPSDSLLAVAGGGDWLIAGLVFGVVGLGACGLHPVIPVILVGEAVPPEVIGLPAEIMGMALLGAWGLSTLVSPFSGTTLMMSRFVRAPSYEIAWRWNAPYVALAATAVSLSVIAAWRMQVY